MRAGGLGDTASTMDATQPIGRLRGLDLLLAHWRLLEEPVEAASPYERLSDALGEELARLLVGALARASRSGPPAVR